MRTKFNNVVTFIEHVGLGIVGIATLFAMGADVRDIMVAMKVSLADILMLFLYVEVISMISIYYKTGKLPVIVVLYIGIVSLTRFLVLDIKELNTWEVTGLSASVFIFTLATFLVKYSDAKYPGESCELCEVKNKK